MPIYEFKCRQCGNTFETLVFASDGDASPECPECGTRETQRILSSFSCGAGGGSTFAQAGSTACGPSSGGFS
ncbi:MAG: FmdB family zinc ribbon protein [Desulfobacteraceae bacterium]